MNPHEGNPRFRGGPPQQQQQPMQSFNSVKPQSMQMMPNQAATGSSAGSLPICSGCNKGIAERFLLKAMNELWHEDCLKCSACYCRLGEVGSTLYTRANLLLCKRDYLRMFGSTGTCSACRKPIPAFEMVMRAKNYNYHLDCFACHRCSHRFCVGDRFYQLDDRVLCEFDYEQEMKGSIVPANHRAKQNIP